MHEIVVLSGKGGTGKTSVSAALAVVAGNECTIADCDVDAANMHLILQPDFAHKEDFYSGEYAEIQQEICTQCGKCMEVCHFDAIHENNNSLSIELLDCEGCDYCRKVCPEDAIIMHSRKSGQLFKSTLRTGQKMVHARMDIGADNSGKLVAEVKKHARQIAQKEKKEYILIDGSPGTGCPVVSALAGASYVLLVTEASMSGLHDLRRVVEVIQRQKTACACIINKANLNEEKHAEIRAYLHEQKIPHLASFNWDKSFNAAMMEEKTIAEYSTIYKSIFQDIWNQIKNTIQLPRKN
jgi:MinD superfamily P-loop ATPase